MRHIKEIMIVAVCLMVLSFCVCTGFGIYFMYREGVQEYEDLRTYVKETDEDDHTEGTDGSDGKQTVVDFKALKKINPDVVSWITIPGTNIDYPLLQGKDNNQYLHKDMEGRDSAAGAIFLDHGDKADLSSRHNIIYGHHMKNGTMFKDIVKYKDQQYFDEHQDIILYTPDREIHLKALAAVVANPDAIRRKIDFQSWEEFTSYIEEMTQTPALLQQFPKERPSDASIPLSPAVTNFRTQERFYMHMKKIRQKITKNRLTFPGMRDILNRQSRLRHIMTAHMGS